jgi:hypothetical protein
MDQLGKLVKLPITKTLVAPKAKYFVSIYSFFGCTKKESKKMHHGA